MKNASMMMVTEILKQEKTNFAKPFAKKFRISINMLTQKNHNNHKKKQIQNKPIHKTLNKRKNNKLKRKPRRKSLKEVFKVNICTKKKQFLNEGTRTKRYNNNYFCSFFLCFFFFHVKNVPEVIFVIYVFV